MPNISDFWDVGPHQPLPVEATWRQFVHSVGGEIIEDLIPEPRTFENADFFFREFRAVAELKAIETEFSARPEFVARFSDLMRRLAEAEPDWKPAFFGGASGYPKWFMREYVRMFRPPLARILKKANRQIRRTKVHFRISSPTGILVLVNDEFTSLGPELIRALVCDLLLHSYSSIDCFLYLTVNRYIEFPNSDTPGLLWAPVYSDRAPEELVDFIDDLGRMWRKHLEGIIGPFTASSETPTAEASLRGARAIIIPDTD